ncbi:uncharacterized protein RAG0_12320 [Rhynchosporium agropyri]|uniref:Uncharacterized protein n=1 Tax=Rhynchosporium agropyri TaxID=914238 RepID=A0A1E1L7W2_9HELO|nr:uncharacterized protein RAG0_12320 [Rhynchosporium agropyri]
MNDSWKNCTTTILVVSTIRYAKSSPFGQRDQDIIYVKKSIFTCLLKTYHHTILNGNPEKKEGSCDTPEELISLLEKYGKPTNAHSHININLCAYRSFQSARYVLDITESEYCMIKSAEL